MDIILVTATFSLVTIGTMLMLVLFSVKGLSFIPKLNFERYIHAIAGCTILLCGIGVQFLGL